VIIWVTILIIWLNWFKEEKTFDDVVRNNSVDYN